MAERSKHLHERKPPAAGQQAASGFLPQATLPRNPPDEPIAIAEMANHFGVTHRTLHFYEEKGLLSAGRIGLMRVYTRADMQRMALINTCREIGMPVAVIQELLEELSGATSQEEADGIFRQALRTRRRELTAALSTIQRQSQQIERLLSDDDDHDDAPTAHRIAVQLTDLEKRCLELMAEGYTPMRLSRALGLQSDEIAALEERIIRKFDANNRFQAVAKAVLLGVVAS
ncbi:MerR family transcriptional regulator [Ciceribacter sp. L1K23]|uniref:MerR family transcriptional regulator n=1 Tax=Ciceribacter sp. L1K23 TaxID=2820276 RepID=UPI001B820D36|nr:MerR family transcriptional regulator [Ciceribacter sp. L1K23]MBR0555178.1 MerR family transcriptional regulator [Ciceribacter sp. L1K23]